MEVERDEDKLAMLDSGAGSRADRMADLQPVAMVAERREVADVAISGESGPAPASNKVLAISGYKSRSPKNATSKTEPNNLRIFPTAISGGLFGITQTGPVWRKPRRPTKPGNPKVAADGYEWRHTPTGNGWVLWRRPYLPNGRRGKSSYVAAYASHSVKEIERLYGKREISKSKRAARPGSVDSGHYSNQDTGESQANFG